MDTAPQQSVQLSNGIQIRRGMVMPPPDPKHGARKYDFEKLEVGDNLFVPFNGVDPDKVRSRVHSAVTTYKLRKPGAELQIRTETDGVAVWTTKKP